MAGALRSRRQKVIGCDWERVSAVLGDLSIRAVLILLVAAFAVGFAVGPASPVGFLKIGGDHSGHAHGGAGSADELSAKAIPAGAPAVRIELDEFLVRLDRLTVPAGPVKLVIDNRGKIEHELMVVPEAKLRALGREPDADALHKAVVLSVHGLAPGTGPSERGVDLKPGKYVVLCNLPGHLAAGQHVTLQVA